MRQLLTKTTICAATALLLTSVGYAEPPQTVAGGGRNQSKRMMRSALFATLDGDQDGQLSAVEIAAAAESLKVLDQDSDGAITVEELVETSRQRAGERFKALDQDGDGALSAEEIPERMQAMLERFDEDSDGSLSADELESMQQRIQERIQRGRAGKGQGGRGRAVEGDRQARRRERFDQGPNGPQRRGRGAKRPEWKQPPGIEQEQEQESEADSGIVEA